MPRVSEERQAKLTKLLLTEKQRLWAEVRRDLFERVGEELHGQREIPQDAGDQSLIDLLEDTNLAIADIHRQELTRIDETLDRLRQGHYGICEDCGETISLERLRVSPYAACCVSCQARREGPHSEPGKTL